MNLYSLVVDISVYSPEWFILSLMITITNPSIAIREKDKRRLKACAINPINGGPSKNPRNPMLATDAMAAPVAILCVFPAKV